MSRENAAPVSEAEFFPNHYQQIGNNGKPGRLVSGSAFRRHVRGDHVSARVLSQQDRDALVCGRCGTANFSDLLIIAKSEGRQVSPQVASVSWQILSYSPSDSRSAELRNLSSAHWQHSAVRHFLSRLWPLQPAQFHGFVP